MAQSSVQRREHSTESSGSTKGKEILDQVTGCCLLKKECAPWSWLLRERLIVVNTIVYGLECCYFSVLCPNIQITQRHFTYIF
jgi:hypothetical protein